MNLLTRVVPVFRARTGCVGNLWFGIAARPCAAVRGASAAWQGSRFSPAELVGLVGWPIDAPRVPVWCLVWLRSSCFGADSATGGRLWGYSTWPAWRRERYAAGGRWPVAQSYLQSLRWREVGVAGFARRPGPAGWPWCLVLDGKGDLAEEICG